MKRSSNTVAGLLLAGILSLGMAGCGTGQLDGSGDTGAAASQPSTLFIKTGTIATDSWGDTGSAPVDLAAPVQAQVTLKEHTMLQGVLPYGMRVVVSGTSATKVGYSADLTTLPAAARSSAPAGFVSYVDVQVVGAATTLPAYYLAVDSGSIPAGETVTIYSYDAVTRTWTNPVTAVAGNGKISFQATDFGLYGIFRS
jgi:hypothetical protein